MGRGRRRHGQLLQQAAVVERAGDHRHLAAFHGPVGAGPVAVNLNAIIVRVGKINGLADPVVGQALDRLATLDQTREDRGEGRPVGYEQGDVEEPGDAFRGLEGGGVLGERDDGGGVCRKMQRERVGVGLLGDEPQGVTVERQHAGQAARDESNVAEDKSRGRSHGERLHRSARLQRGPGRLLPASGFLTTDYTDSIRIKSRTSDR